MYLFCGFFINWILTSSMLPLNLSTPVKVFFLQFFIIFELMSCVTLPGQSFSYHGNFTHCLYLFLYYYLNYLDVMVNQQSILDRQIKSDRFRLCWSLGVTLATRTIKETWENKIICCVKTQVIPYTTVFYPIFIIYKYIYYIVNTIILLYDGLIY